MQKIQSRQCLQRDTGQRFLIVTAARSYNILQTTAIHVLNHERHAAFFDVAEGVVEVDDVFVWLLLEQGGPSSLRSITHRRLCRCWFHYEDNISTK
jgi:sensor histidine kinase regulating citrate/malate metabolism